jgi:hypothetical protein
MNRLPVVAIDRPTANVAPSYPTSRSVQGDPAAIANPFPGALSRTNTSGSIESLSAPVTGSKERLTKPLVAPEGFDGKPHWNPKLLPPSSEAAQDKVALRWTTSMK